jgi:hypothetical protein
VISGRATAHIALIEETAHRLHTADDCAGFDMRALNPMTGSSYPAGELPGALTVRSAAVGLPAMDISPLFL